MTYYSKKRGVKKSFKNGKVKSRLSFKNKNKKNRKNKKTRTRRRNRRLNGGTDDDILKTLNVKGYNERILEQDFRLARAINLMLILIISDCYNITDSGDNYNKVINHLNKYTDTKIGNYVNIFIKNIQNQNGGSNSNSNSVIISSPITFQINNEDIQVNAKVVNELRIQLQDDENSLSKLESVVNRIVPEVEPSASGHAPIPDLATINAQFATLKAEYERDRALAELREVKAKLEAGTGAQVDSVELLSRHVVDHIVEKNLKAIDDISKTRPALFEFLQREGMQDTINNLVDINALLE